MPTSLKSAHPSHCLRCTLSEKSEIRPLYTEKNKYPPEFIGSSPQKACKKAPTRLRSSLFEVFARSAQHPFRLPAASAPAAGTAR